MYLWVYVCSIKVKLYIHMYLWVYVRSNRVLDVNFFSKKKEEMKNIYSFDFQISSNLWL